MSQPAATQPGSRPPTERDERIRELAELLLFHGGEWTEEDYEALPEGVRAELHDGSLILLPNPEPDHQFASRGVANRLSELLGDSRLVLEHVDVRMAGGRRYRTPDVVALREHHRKRPLPPSKVLMAVEILSPGGGDEYETKWTAYREADLKWYLIIAPTDAGPRAELYHLEDGKYILASNADVNEKLRLPAPFDGDISLGELAY